MLTHAFQVKAPKKLDEKQRALLQAYAELEPGKLTIVLFVFLIKVKFPPCRHPWHNPWLDLPARWQENCHLRSWWTGLGVLLQNLDYLKLSHVQVAAIREALSEEIDDEVKKEEAREEGA